MESSKDGGLCHYASELVVRPHMLYPRCSVAISLAPCSPPSTLTHNNTDGLSLSLTTYTLRSPLHRSPQWVLRAVPGGQAGGSAHSTETEPRVAHPLLSCSQLASCKGPGPFKPGTSFPGSFCGSCGLEGTVADNGRWLDAADGMGCLTGMGRRARNVNAPFGPATHV